MKLVEIGRKRIQSEKSWENQVNQKIEEQLVRR
jgi:hypothetical protein